LSGFLFSLERSGFLVALGTLSFGNSSVGNIKYDSPIVRSMGIVAGSTVGGFHRIIPVLSCKRYFVGLMALETEGRGIPFQQKT
jgi:hypothetical protein